MKELAFADAWDSSPDWAVDPPGTRFTVRGRQKQTSDSTLGALAGYYEVSLSAVSHLEKAMLTIYHVPGTRGVRAIWLCEELGLPYTVETVDFSPEFRRSAQWRAFESRR